MPKLHDTIYSTSALLNVTRTGNVNCVSIRPPCMNTFNQHVLRPMFGQSCQDQSEKPMMSIYLILYFSHICHTDESLTFEYNLI
jgi:citrate synthase